jgi:hypothetical protein
MKSNIDKYNGLTDSTKHIQNIRSTLKLAIQRDVIFKIFPITFHVSAKLWYHSLELCYLFGLHDICMKLILVLVLAFHLKKHD